MDFKTSSYSSYCVFSYNKAQGKIFLGRESNPIENHNCNGSGLKANLEMFINFSARTDLNHTD